MKATCLLLLTLPAAFGQVALQGRVLSGPGGVVPYTSVVLRYAHDSVGTTHPLLGTTTNEQGYYSFSVRTAGQYVVQVSAVGYQTTRSAVINVLGEPVTVAPITLTEAVGQLNAVQVTARKPFIEQQPDRIIVNVAQSIVASGSTALEVLQKAPGITVDYQNERLLLRGREGTVVQLDGRQSYLSAQDVIALLRSMSSDNIETIELITNPGARYDAAGNAGIINIRLKKNRDVGTNGSLSAGLGSGRYGRQRGSLQLNHRTSRLNLFGSYSLNRGGNYWNFYKTVDQPDPSSDNANRRNLVEIKTLLRDRDLGQNAKAGFDWMPGKRTTLGLVWTGLWTTHSERGPASTSFRRTAVSPLYLLTNTEKTFDRAIQNQVINVNLSHSFDPKDASRKPAQLTADLDWGHFVRDFNNRLITRTLIATEGELPPAGLLTTQPTTIDILSAKVDLSLPLSTGWKADLGLKTATVSTDNDLSLYIAATPGELVRDPQLSTRFTYIERVNAAYVNVAGKWGKTDIQAGLRLECTHSTGRSYTLNEVADRQYTNLFPSLFLTHPLPKGQLLTGSYSYRIDRPNYQNLNPARSYIDQFSYVQGNAFLRPQFTHALEARYALKSGVFASVAANYTRDLLSFLLFVTEGNKSYRTALNLGRATGYTVTLGWPIAVAKGWQLQTNWLAVYNYTRFDYEGSTIEIRNLSGRLNGNNAFTLGNGWTAELNGWLRTPMIDIASQRPWQGTLDAGVQKSVSSALKLKLTVQDILHSDRIIGNIYLPNNQQTVRIRQDTRLMLLSLNYGFGNQRLKAARQRRTASEDETRRTN